MSLPSMLTSIGGEWTLAKTHYQLFSVAHIDLEVVLLASVHKNLGQFSVFPGVPICDEMDNYRVTC